jgi:hypothetical protein
MVCYFYQSFQKSLEPLQSDADHVNDHANQLQAAHVILSHTNVRRLEEFNTRLDSDQNIQFISIE